MSVILDALKKLDREKASRRQGTTNIAMEILRPDLPRRTQRTPLYLTIVALTALVTAGLTYTVVKSYFASKFMPPITLNAPANMKEPLPGPRHSPASGLTEFSPSPAPAKVDVPPPPKADLQPKPSLPPVLSSPVAIPPAPSQPLAPVTASPESIRATQEGINRVSPKIESPPESKPVPSPPPDKESGQNVIVEKANVPPKNTEQSVPRSPIAPSSDPPTLRVSAIVWHEEPAKRIAVINGMITTEQSLIEGAKVLEIHPNRVRLTHNDRLFELLLK